MITALKIEKLVNGSLNGDKNLIIKGVYSQGYKAYEVSDLEAHILCGKREHEYYVCLIILTAAWSALYLSPDPING